MHRLRVFLFALLVAVLLIPATPALAFEGVLPDGKIVFGDDYTLEAGDTLDGDLVVFGGDVELEEDSEVNGNVIVWGGNVDVSGRVEGDLVAFGGNVDLHETAVVEGDLATVGGVVEQEEGAEVYGQHVVEPEMSQWEWPGPIVIPIPQTGPIVMQNGIPRMLVTILWKGLQTLLVTVVMAVLAGIVAVLWPQPAARVGKAAEKSILPSFGMGFLTVVVVATLLLSICLTPIGALALVAAGIAAVFGWSALGILIGERMLVRRTVHPFWSAALGAGLLTLLSGLLDVIPCVGWLGGFLVMCVGLGAVILTRFGTETYPLLYPASTVVDDGAEEAAEG